MGFFLLYMEILFSYLSFFFLYISHKYYTIHQCNFVGKIFSCLNQAGLKLIYESHHLTITSTDSLARVHIYINIVLTLMLTWSLRYGLKSAMHER